MPKKKRKLTAAERAARKRRKLEFMTIFIGGRQKRVRRPTLIDGLTEDEFLRRNADPVWLVQNGYFELLEPAPEPGKQTVEPLFPAEASESGGAGQPPNTTGHPAGDAEPALIDNELPF